MLSDGEKVFDRGWPDAKEEQLLKENADLKRMIGELHVELKKAKRSGFETSQATLAH